MHEIVGRKILAILDALEKNDLLMAVFTDAAIELLVVASLRGDNELPHPSADSKHWTARTQTAWDELYQIVEMLSPVKVEEGIIMGRKHESRIGI